LAGCLRDVEFKTECFANQTEKKVKEAVKELGEGCRVNSTVIHCLARSTRGVADGTEIKPPEMAFQSGGYWKPLMPSEIGQDKDGTPIVGRSWVTRTENWSASKPQAFLLTRPVPPVTGPDAGIIYVMRSDAHALEVYKIGLTRRTAGERSRELSSATGVPLPFGILAQWDVGDCAGVEAAVHEKLRAYRVSDRREFFRLPLRSIVAVINSVVEASMPKAR
jgi:T5orf172 domain